MPFTCQKFSGSQEEVVLCLSAFWSVWKSLCLLYPTVKQKQDTLEAPQEYLFLTTYVLSLISTILLFFCMYFPLI